MLYKVLERYNGAIAIGVVGSLGILKLVDAVIGLRVAQSEEVQGLDLSQHGEEGYNLDLGLATMATAEPAAAVAPHAAARQRPAFESES